MIPRAARLSSLLLLILFAALTLAAMGRLRVPAPEPHPGPTQDSSASASSEFVQAEVVVAGGLSASDLTREFDSLRLGVNERRSFGVHRLREAASATQARVLAFLSHLVQSGMARGVQSHWLTNTITVDLMVSAVNSTALHPDVLAVIPRSELTRSSPMVSQRAPAAMAKPATGVEPNLQLIGADSAWKMGYTGKGRIVCSFDFGPDGHHPALYDNWKGHDGDSLAAWFSADSASSFPAPCDPVNREHGTQTMAIMVGHDKHTGDTVGVAPDAQWISACSFNATIDALEWAADPDGDPNTDDDVPDVICHTWASGRQCSYLYSEAVDLLEALGIVNIFSAGNRGSDSMTVGGLAGNAHDSLDNFAVGSVDHGTGQIYWSSSRGPSACDGLSIKPNVVAPGVLVRSALPDGQYGLATGTSMAAPHVAGAALSCGNMLRMQLPVRSRRLCWPVASLAVIRLPTTTMDGESSISQRPSTTFPWGQGLIYACHGLIIPL